MLSASCHFMATPGDAGSDVEGLCNLMLHHALWGAEEKREPATFLPGAHLQWEPFICWWLCAFKQLHWAGIGWQALSR